VSIHPHAYHKSWLATELSNPRSSNFLFSFSLAFPALNVPAELRRV
jgi:hypothetical protein